MNPNFWQDLLKLVALVIVAIGFFIMGLRSGEYNTQVKAVKAGVGEFVANQNDATVSFRWVNPTNAVK